MRSLVPADSLVYLETNDLAAALQPIIDSKPFNEVAKSKPDLSPLKGVQIAVAVTGFETSEEKVNDEQSIGRIQPRFVAIADTHSWNFQAVGFAETKLGSFVAKIYDSEPTLEQSEKHGGKYFTWTATDRRKAYALVIDSLIYFGNDKTSIEKCLAVKRGETDSIIKTGKIQSADTQTLASGYVSTDGVAQIANIVGLKFASEAAEGSEIQSAIAGIVPKLLRNSIAEISWTASKANEGIEDKYFVTTNPEIAQVLSETITPSNQGASVELFAPQNAESVTRYGLEDLHMAWRTLLLTVQKQVDPLEGRLLAEFSNTFFQPFGIADPEMFLSSVNSSVMTVRLDEEGDQMIVIASIGDTAKLKGAIDKEIDFSQNPMKMRGEEMWQSSDGSLAFVRQMGFALIGDPRDIQHCVDANYGPQETHLENFRKFLKDRSPVITLANDSTIATAIVDMLSEKKSDNAKSVASSSVETRFTKTGIERHTVSDFGLIGSIIAQLGRD